MINIQLSFPVLCWGRTTIEIEPDENGNCPSDAEILDMIRNEEILLEAGELDTFHPLMDVMEALSYYEEIPMQMEIV